MTRNNKVIKISVLGDVSEIDDEQQRHETRDRTQSVYSLPFPEYWERDRKFRLAITMLDRFEPGDDLNIQATILFNRLRTRKRVVAITLIYGDVYISNETVEEIIDFTKDDFKYVLRHMPRGSVY